MKKFYDTHIHIMNLSHPNLSAMLKRIFKDIGIAERLKIGIGAFLFVIMGKTLPKLIKVDNRLVNLLAIMETELGDYMLQLEEDLRNNSLSWGSGPVILGRDEEIKYNKIVLTPLIMDFGLKNYEMAKTLYKVRWKPIASQVRDICLGIKNYYTYRDNNELPGDRPETPLFEIYPFMGINTRNYEEKTKPDGTLGLEDLLANNFAGFENDSIDTRRKNLEVRDWRDFKGDIETISPYDFIGIKVYPPLGFNPWPNEPGEKKEEMEKVRYLYKFCEDSNVPITSHCTSGGFLVEKRYAEFAKPDKWTEVLKVFKNLRLNLAHFGADDKEWRKAIARLILEYPNVYTDISYRGVDTGYYAELRNFLKPNGYSAADWDKLMTRIIFGSDFMINLIAIESYSQYMKNFAETYDFSAEEKDMFCRRNPESFLFIG